MAEGQGRNRRFRAPEMEGTMARWFARQRGSPRQIIRCKEEAARFTHQLPAGAKVLEVAPGPGYLAIEIARLGRFEVTGLDISHTMVEIATENAQRAGVSVDFRRGDATMMPFTSESFDLVVCQAAFKNFRRPLNALNEMHRVLHRGRGAVIQDLSRDASDAEIDQEVQGMGLRWLSAWFTRVTLGTMLRRRAYSPTGFKRLVARSDFHACDIHKTGISLEAQLTKSRE